LFFRLKRARGIEYLQVVANNRQGPQVRQKVLASLGRVDDLRADGSLHRLIGTGAAMSNDAIFLAPPNFGASLELVQDETLQVMLVELLTEHPRCAEVISTVCQTNPAIFRRLVAEVTFSGLGKALTGASSQHFLGLGQEEDGARRREVSTIVDLAGAVSGPDNGRDEGLVLGIRTAAQNAARPSLMHGAVSFVSATITGTPLAAGHWPAHLPPLKAVRDVSVQIAKRLAANDIAVVFDRTFASPAFLSALGKLDLRFILPLRESAVRPDPRYRMSDWICHDTRPPRRDEGSERNEFEAAARGIRFVKIVDRSAAERDWRLRNVQLERLEHTVDALGPVAQGFARLNTARQALLEGEEWDGVTLLATNLLAEPKEIARRYAAAASTRLWEQEMTAFGQQLLELDTAPRDTAALLTGAVRVGLVAGFLRDTIVQLLGKHMGRHCGWEELSAALAQHRSVRITQGSRFLTLAPEAPPILASLLEVLGLPLCSMENRPRRSRPGFLLAEPVE
jgi:hypothetical protein